MARRQTTAKLTRLVDAIECDIANGLKTSEIMNKHDVEYYVVARIRFDMEYDDHENPRAARRERTAS